MQSFLSAYIALSLLKTMNTTFNNKLLKISFNTYCTHTLLRKLLRKRYSEKCQWDNIDVKKRQQQKNKQTKNHIHTHRHRHTDTDTHIHIHTQARTDTRTHTNTSTQTYTHTDDDTL